MVQSVCTHLVDTQNITYLFALVRVQRLLHGLEVDKAISYFHRGADDLYCVLNFSLSQHAAGLAYPLAQLSVVPPRVPS